MAALRQALATVAILAFAPATRAAADPLDRWSSQIREASARFGIPAAWIRRVMRVESGGRTMLHGKPIVSSAGAMGLMQLMPGTWREMRLALGLGPNPNEPRDNILAGTAYLRAMYDRFGYPGLFAAYNAGPARYAAALSGRRALPAETRSYLSSIAGVDGSPTTPSPTAALFAVERGGDPQPRVALSVSGSSGPLFVCLSSAGAQ